MTASKRTDNVAEFFDNGIEEETSPQLIDEHYYESAAKLCTRLDISLSKFLKLISDNRDQVEVYDVGDKSVRYKLMDVLRLMRRRH